MYCENCKLSNMASNAIFPMGSAKPEFYVLGDIATIDEIKNGQVFISSVQAHQYLMNTLSSLDMSMDNTRLFKLVRCCPQTYDENEYNGYRESCHNYSFIDIFKTKPKIIIGLGSEVARIMIKDKFRSISGCRGRLYDVEINGEYFKFMPTFSPNYVINNPSASDQFIKDIMHAKSYVQGELVDIAAKELTWAITYDEFKAYYDRKLVQSKMPAYDLETNAYDARSNMARMVGFSLAPDTTGGIYVVRNSLEYKMPEEDWEKIAELTKQYLMARTALVHNIMYEGPFTLNEWGIDILDNFEDTLVKARMLRGGELGGAGLKDQCIINLGYPDWDTDLDNYKSAFNLLRKKLKPTSSGKVRWDFEFIRERGLCALIDEYAYLDDEGELDSRCQSNYEAVLSIRDTLLKYYETDADYSIIMEIVGDEICNLIDAEYDGPFSYGFIPMKLIRKYGAMDAVGTQDLNVYLEDQMDKLSEQLGIDLHKGYFYTKRQFIAGVQMELNGLHWNDEVASHEEKWCEDNCYQHLMALIDSPFLDNHLLKKKRWIFDDWVYENQLDMVREILGEFKIMKSCIKLADGTKYKPSQIVDVLSERLGYDFYEANRELALKLIRDAAHRCEHFTDLKSFYNPGSNTADMKSLVNSILITNDIKIAYLLNRLNVMIDEEGFDITKYPPSDRKLFQVLIDCKKYNKYVDEFNKILDDDSNDKELMESFNAEFDDEDFSEFESYEEGEEGEEGSESARRKIKLTDEDTFRKFFEVLQTVQVQSSEVQRLVGEALNYQLENLNEFSIIDLHRYYVITGVVLDDQSTWTDRFWFLINFRIYKKCYKMRSTYITGNRVGRGQVWMVNKDDLATGEILTRRRRKYNGHFAEDETPLMQASYAVCSAETLRWRAGMHTIPSDSTIKNIYDSRYKGGTIFAPDFSQMEIRCMAGASKCTPMIEAFKNGADIHMENAIKIFRKPKEQITPAERRYSKMASFQILYGGTPHSFGMEYLDGDVALAQSIYDSFYAAYPEIKAYIDARHDEMRRTGRVTTIMNTYINVSPEKYKGDESKALRAAQNYPIQSAGSYMAGNVVYEVIKYLRDRDMLSKVELFIHDSIEIDVHPKEMLQLAVTILPLMNKYPMDEFGIPTTADLVCGVSIGQELECTDIHTNEDYTVGDMICEGMEKDFMLLMDKWKEVYEVVEYEFIEDPKPVYESWSQLFVTKRAINPYYGTTRNKVKAKVHIEYGDKINQIFPDYKGRIGVN